MRTPVFRSNHYRLIAEAISLTLEDEAEKRKISRHDLDDEAALVIDALSGLFTVDNGAYDQAQFQVDMRLDIGPVSKRAINRASRILAINGVGE